MDEMNLKASAGGVGIQINGNVSSGISSTEVANIIQNLYDLNFPRLVEEASKKAQENVLLFEGEFLKEINDDISQIQERLKEPNGQYLLNASVQQAARLGDDANLQLLSKALKNALLCDDKNDFASISALALELIPQLKKEELLAILISFLVHVISFGLDNLQAIDFSMCICINNYRKMGDVAQTQLYHMVSLGIYAFNSFAGDKCIDLLSRRYSYIPSFRDKVSQGNFESIKFIIDYYDRNGLVKFHPLPVANIIGFLLLKENLPTLDIGILLK